jgi:hypothetical protein
MHCVSRFPDGTPPGRAWGPLTLVLYGWAAAQALLLAPFPDPAGSWLASLVPSGLMYRLAFPGLFLVSDFLLVASVVLNYRRAGGPDQRRRLRWIAAAFVLTASWPVANAVLRVAMDAEAVARHAGFFQTMHAWWAAMSLSSSAAVAYAIVRQRLFDVEVVIRRGLQYMLARNGLRALVVAPATLLVWIVVTNRDLTVADLLSTGSGHIYVMALAAAGLKYRDRLTVWLDRRFFREAYDRERVLLDLIERIKTIDTTERLASTVADALDASLHPKSLRVWFRSPADESFVSILAPPGAPASVPPGPDAPLMRALDRAPASVASPFAELAGPDGSAAAPLVALGVDLVVPIRGTDHRLLGVILAGERKSEEPYATKDRELLVAIATQMGAVAEVALLRARVDREQRVRRQVLARLDAESVSLLKECPACGACFAGSVERCDRDGVELTWTLPIERIVDGKYRLDRLLGRGGMGAVYEAVDMRLGRSVAVKILLAGGFGDPAALRRFEREARAAALLSHPNIVAVHDYGSVGEGAYLVMELLAGATLRTELTRRGALPAPLAADWLAQICDGLEVAHRSGVVHRDLKPENVLIASLGARPLVKILDFGLARVGMMTGGETATAMTAAGTILGTLGYMAPEQLAGAAVDQRADIFAIGAIAAETITGRRAFEGETFAEILHATHTSVFRIPGCTAAQQRLEAVLQKSMARDPEDRFGSVAELRAALIPAIRASAG